MYKMTVRFNEFKNQKESCNENISKVGNPDNLKR